MSEPQGFPLNCHPPALLVSCVRCCFLLVKATYNINKHVEAGGEMKERNESFVCVN